MNENKEDHQVNAVCHKCLLAQSLGVRLLYCQRCEVVELELGAFTLRLSPQSVQRIANVMMKASLKLDRMTSNLREVHAQEQEQAQNNLSAPQLLH